ncbi:cytosolic protein [Nostoc sp. 'Peltigera membranacea cyanobiont' 213]|uniref:cytosolic protein n=1 Tax=Nostoc sp. 'Peltigera membranacea cyanobiont' 213 TaxID=2014530 RepID=UPI000B95A05B|nr:cytosolic protein [Nostoc sp. 'Peltigera membranacea cyanobiont' 213]OYD87460.1 cytosolic protein [Nostoc sp. 'Peltigera membranacea cyanobiont' 213]
MINTNPQTEYDSPWKQILQLYFEDFMLFFFPQAHREIDWTRQPEFLDKELEQVVRDAELGKRLADKLVKIYRIGGEETWILIHLEIQSQSESDFSERMFTYNYRIYDRYKRSVASLAILGDEQVNWRPNRFGYELFGTKVEFQFPIVKLLDYQQRQSELEASRNPLATVVMAHLAALQTLSDRLQRKQQKLSLVRRLYQQGFEREDVLNLLAFVDWVLTLPQDLEREFQHEVEQLEAEQRMQYVTSFERSGIEKGKLEALLKGIALGLKLKFGETGQNLLPEIESIQDVSLLEAILEGIDTASTVSQLRQIYQSPTTDTQQ